MICSNQCNENYDFFVNFLYLGSSWTCIRECSGLLIAGQPFFTTSNDKTVFQDSKSLRTLTRPSVDYTDDEDITGVVELPQAESTAEENNISKAKKPTKKGKSKSKWECGFTSVLFPMSFHIQFLCFEITDMKSWCINKNMKTWHHFQSWFYSAKWEAFQSNCPRRFGRRSQLQRWWNTKFEIESILSFIHPGEHSPSTAVKDVFEDFVNFSTGDKAQNLNLKAYLSSQVITNLELKVFYLLSIQENMINPEMSKTILKTLSTAPQVIKHKIWKYFIFYPSRRTSSNLKYPRRFQRLCQLFCRW